MQAVAELFDDRHSGDREGELEGELVQEVGTVEVCEGELFVVARGRRWRAEPAVSCLVEPCDGDRVLVAHAGAHADAREAFVLAVLKRTSGEAPRLRVEGDLRVSSGGRISFVAPDGVDIATERDVNVMSGRFTLRAKESQLIVDSLAYIGKLVRVDTDKVKSFVGMLDQVAERFSLKAKRSYRFVDEVDVTRAEQVDIRARENLNVRGKNAVVNAEQLVKVDGRQIHLG